jgi:hypothetical protein
LINARRIGLPRFRVEQWIEPGPELLTEGRNVVGVELSFVSKWRITMRRTMIPFVRYNSIRRFLSSWSRPGPMRMYLIGSLPSLSPSFSLKCSNSIGERLLRRDFGCRHL